MFPLQWGEKGDIQNQGTNHYISSWLFTRQKMTPLSDSNLTPFPVLEV